MSWVGIIIGLQDGDIEVAWANGMVSKVVLLSLSLSTMSIFSRVGCLSDHCLTAFQRDLVWQLQVYYYLQGQCHKTCATNFRPNLTCLQLM